MTVEKQKVALVLSSGGARGIAHIAVIEELLHAGFTITSIAGSSMGALIGGIYACGALTDYKNWVSTLDYWDVFNLLDFSLSSKGFIKGEKVFKRITPFISDIHIESLPIPFVAVAADIVNKTQVIFTKGSLKEAIRASVSIPTVLHPVETDRGLLVDGGITNPVPVDLVKRSKGDILVVVDVNAYIPVTLPEITQNRKSILDNLARRYFKWKNNEHAKYSNLGIFDMINESFNLTQETLSRVMLERYKPDITIRISRKACSTMDFHKSEELLDMGKKAFSEAFEKYKETLEA